MKELLELAEHTWKHSGNPATDLLHICHLMAEKYRSDTKLLKAKIHGQREVIRALQKKEEK